MLCNVKKVEVLKAPHVGDVGQIHLHLVLFNNTKVGHEVLFQEYNLGLKRLRAGITTYSPLRQWNAGAGHKLALEGVGGLGHMAVKLAAPMGAEVTVLSTSPGKEADARTLGAQRFVVTKDPKALEKVKNSFGFIINTVSAKVSPDMYASLLRRDGTMILLGVPPEAPELHAATLIFGRRRFAGSLIGGVAETQEMLDYCAEHNILSEVEVIPIDYINEAYERMLKGDVKYRFVIDLTSL